MYIPDNYDVFAQHERENDRQLRLNRRVSAEEKRAGGEPLWVEHPNDYGTHDRNLYFEEVPK